MDTEKINAVLTKAIVGMQEREIEDMSSVTESAKGMSSADFCDELKRRLASVAKNKILRCKSSGLGRHDMAIINFYNVELGVGKTNGGAVAENNRMMLTVDGFGRNEGDPSPSGKVKLEMSVWSFSRDPWNVKRPRGKTATPEKVLDTVVKIIKDVSKLKSSI